MDFPESAVDLARDQPRSSADKDALSGRDRVAFLARDDPTLSTRPTRRRARRSSTDGELHLEVLVHRLEREFGVRVQTGKPRVAYRQTSAGDRRARLRASSAVEGALRAREVAPRTRAVAGEGRVRRPVEPGCHPEAVRAEREVGRPDLVPGRRGIRLPGRPVARHGDRRRDPRERASEIAFEAAGVPRVPRRSPSPRASCVVLEPIMRFEVQTPGAVHGRRARRPEPPPRHDRRRRARGGGPDDDPRTRADLGDVRDGRAQPEPGPRASYSMVPHSATRAGASRRSARRTSSAGERSGGTRRTVGLFSACAAEPPLQSEVRALIGKVPAPAGTPRTKREELPRRVAARAIDGAWWHRSTGRFAVLATLNLQV